MTNAARVAASTLLEMKMPGKPNPSQRPKNQAAGRRISQTPAAVATIGKRVSPAPRNAPA